ncbi:MAG TPA: hypothetical protein VF517_00890 [Thermoleophilaceae bacterium]|jgi:hypothetical protein
MTRGASVAAAFALALVAAAPAAAAPYTTRSGPERPNPVFGVTYEGSGSYATTFHGEPPNDGGDDDTNDAHDSSRQSWDLGFRHGLALPDCAKAATDGSSACSAVTGLTGARGATVMTGRVDHRHVDGLYSQLDRTVRCRLRGATSPRSKVDAELSVRHLPDSAAFAVTARSPLTTVITAFQSQCPKQGDSIDRILDFYAMPGFSFDGAYGPDRWFTSTDVVIPESVFRGSTVIKVPLRLTKAGRSPKGCAVEHPSYERCRTGGSWRGVLTFTRRG